MCTQAKNILIAVGGRATKLPIPGAEHAIISDDILDLPELPKKLAIVGGGYIALEFAGIYNNFGSETHVVYRQVRLWRSLTCNCHLSLRAVCSRAKQRLFATIAHSWQQPVRNCSSMFTGPGRPF